MPIYTRKGDQGQTSDFKKQKKPKDDPQVLCLGKIDELNVSIGLVRAHLSRTILDDKLNKLLKSLQEIILSTGSEIAGAGEKVNAQAVTTLEQIIDHYQNELPEINNFILPGGSIPSVLTHQARVNCRELERMLVALNRINKLNPSLLAFYNRLSDLLFVLARQINYRDGFVDEIWTNKSSETLETV